MLSKWGNRQAVQREHENMSSESGTGHQVHLSPSGSFGPVVTKSVPAVVKVIAIIRHLNAGPSTGRSLSEIASSLGLTKSHCHNLLKTLVSEGWAVFDDGRRRYTLAPSLLADVSHLIGKGNRPLLVHEELVRLSLTAKAPCVLTQVNKDNSFVAIDKAEEAAELLVSVPIGHRFPADAPAQMRIRLAYLDDEDLEREIAAWNPVARTPTTIVDRDKLKREILRTRERGYSISRSEFTPGVMSLAAGILDRQGFVRLIVQCPGLEADIMAREAEIGKELIRSATRISELTHL